MVIENKLDNRSFGPFASSMGFFLLIIGIVFSFYNLFGLLLAILGAFIAFTSTGTIIDTESRRIRHADYWFGLLPFGPWIEITPGMKLGLREVRSGYRAYSRGMQSTSVHYYDIRIFLYSSEKRKLVPLKKFRTPDEAINGLEEYCNLLMLEAFKA